MKILATFGLGQHSELLDLTMPRFKIYADLHGYDLVTEPVAVCDRPAPWNKLPLLTELLETYDEVLWLDADVVVLDCSKDLADEVSDEHIQAMVFHELLGNKDVQIRTVPNSGVWLLRKPMLPWLDLAWNSTQFIDHAWWEQAAMISLLGFYINRSNMPYRQEPSELYHRTYQLGACWNYRDDLLNQSSGKARIVHAVGDFNTKIKFIKEQLNSCT